MLNLVLALGLLSPPPSAAADTTLLLESGVRRPAYAPDGRLAFELRGDLWVAPEGDATRAVRVTTGPAWDGEPSWAPDARALVFSSDRAGSVDLWRVPLNGDGSPGEPQRLTRSTEPEGEPVVAPDGSIVFVRGAGARADLWLRAPDGEERQLTRAPGAERSPTLAPDGARMAYVREREGRRQLAVRALDAEGETLIVSDRPVEHPAWSPTGDRLAFATGGARPGVWLTSPDGSYVNLLSGRRAAPAWSPDARLLVLAELGGDEPGYNGDPDRGAPRGRADAFPTDGALWLVTAPPAPDVGITSLPVSAPVEREVHNAETLERVWTRLRDLYYADRDDNGSAARWAALRAEFLPRARRARTERELEEVVHAMLRERPTYRPEVRGRAAVSSAHPLATAAGVEMLRQGGNVVDAAVAVSFALGVVEPDASGVGGYGQMLVHLAGMNEPVVIDFLTRVPEQATLDNGALLQGGRLPSDGPVVANVPGTVAGMWRAWQRYGSGKLSWAQLLQPAIRYAEQGFAVDDAFATTLRRERERFAKYPSSRHLFFRDGEPLQAGDTLRNPDLAWTLRQIAEHGADAFYRGEVARRMVADLRGQGNAMTLHDLARYYAPELQPVSTTYRGYTVYSGAPATTGGVTLAARLNLLEQASRTRPYPEDAATLHAMVEAWKLAPSTSGRVADPGLWPVRLEPFVSKDTARARWRCFDPLRARVPPEAARGSEEAPLCEAASPRVAFEAHEQEGHCAEQPASAVHRCRATGTTAFVVGDADGNLVSVTQTLGTWGGNFYVTPGLGFLYNDKLGSYPTDPTAYGARLPYARNATIITPTLVFEGTGARRRPAFAAGAAGNAWISAAVFQALVGMMDWDLGPQRALELPRFLVSGTTLRDGSRVPLVQYEDVLAPAVVEALRGYGHRLQPISLKGELRMGYGAALEVGRGEVRAGADPRRSGAAAAVR